MFFKLDISHLCWQWKTQQTNFSQILRVDHCGGSLHLPTPTSSLLSRQMAVENSFFDLCCVPTDLALSSANVTVAGWLMTPSCLPGWSRYISLWLCPSRAALCGTESNIHCVQTLTVCAGRWENNDEAKTRLRPRRISIYVWEMISVVVLLLRK